MKLTIDYLDKTRHKTVEIPYLTVAISSFDPDSKTLSVNKERMPVWPIEAKTTKNMSKEMLEATCLGRRKTH